MAVQPLRKAGGINSIAATDPNFFLWAGDVKPTTDRGIFKTGQIVPQYTPLAVDADGKYVIWVPGASDTTGKIVAVSLEPMNTGNTAGGTNQDTWGPIYVDGFFNHEALSWPAAIDTLAERKQAVAGTRFNVGRLP